MPLTNGTRIGPYEIVLPIGAGGMGEVYRATDTNLKRQVAIKVLPETLASEPDRLARFQREAELLASLNHPNIAHIYGVEKTAGTLALVMELVEGPTLAELLAAGSRPQASAGLPLPDALNIARQIAEALEAAHERGIIHRDLKPANIKVRDDGTVKVLDFGLAKALDQSSVSSLQSPIGVTASPTLTSPALMTGAGLILGTAAYMAPEQARGRAVDKRADIWAFGCVLYEMVTGRRPFTGDDIGETLAAVIKEQPRTDDLPADVRPLIESCLEKDPKKRLRDIGDAWRILPAPHAITPQAVPRSNWLPWTIAAAALAIAAALLVLRSLSTSTPPATGTPIRLDADVGVDVSRGAGQGPTIAISPDGSRLAIVTPGADGKDHLALRLLGSSQTNALAGTEDAASPFFSPDGRSIAFFAGGKLKKISVEGGAPVVIGDAKNPRGGSWGEDGNIIFAAENRVGLSRVSAEGGEVTAATELDRKAGDNTNRYPQVLPGADAFLFQARPDNGPFTIQAQSVRTGRRTTVLKDASEAHYVSSGYLLFVRQGALYSMPMDVKRLEVSGKPTPVVQDVRENGGNGWAYFDVSHAGTLVYVAATTSTDRTLAWVDSSGNVQPLPIPPGPYVGATASPDGTAFAFGADAGPDTALSVYDVSTNRMSRVVTIRGRVGNVIWAPDGKHLVYSMGRDQTGGGVYWMRADGAGQPERLVDGPGWMIDSVSADGKRIGYWHAQKEYGLWTMPLDVTDADRPKPGKPELFIASNAEIRGPAFSPDGRWAAYSSMESGKQELYVQPFPGGGGKWQISPGVGSGAGGAKWASGNRLFYRSADQRVHVVDYRAEGSSFSISLPRDWSNEIPSGALELSADGRRVLVLRSADGSGPKPLSQVTFVLNFFDRSRSTAAAAP
jgi:serine/threonine-protein kinase